MDVIEATRKALATNRYITRIRFVEKFGGIKIKPTNKPECCIVYKNNKPSVNRWNPKAEDLIAGDWMVVD